MGIRAMIFDLDGTLVQTEKLKALSYAQAVVELCPVDIEEADVIDAFRSVVGRSRQAVAEFLVERFALYETAQARMAEFGVDAPWEALVALRLRYYQTMLANPEALRSNQWPHNVALLRQARAYQCKVALATMSHREQVDRVLEVLGFADSFDVVATRDDVQRGKPDPEIYLMVSDALAVPPEETIVVEDSPSGVRAALAAGMHVVAVGTPFTGGQLQAMPELPASHRADEPEQLAGVIEHIYNTHGTTGRQAE